MRNLRGTIKDILDKMTNDDNLEGRIVRDQLAWTGFIIGAVGGVAYSLIERDSDIITNSSIGAIFGAGLFYCIGTVVKNIQEYI